jgi:hypothetical protein
MFGPNRCGVFLGIVIGVASVACGGNDNQPREPGTGRPAAPPVPKENWIETPTSPEEVRDFYMGNRLNGLEDVYSFLVVIQKAAAQPSRAYELTEVQTNFGVGLTAAKWAGNLTIEPLPETRLDDAAYRLDGGVSPGEARVFVKWGDTLYWPKDPAKPGDFDELNPRNLRYAAKTTHERVEVHHGILKYGEPLPTNIRLRVGQTLVIRLGPDHSVLSSANPAPVRQEGSRTEESGWVVLTYKAVAPGSADLVRIDPPTDKQPGQKVVLAGIKVE